MKKALGAMLLAGFLLVLALVACGETDGIDVEATATALASNSDEPVSSTPEESAPSESTRLGEWVEASGLAMVAHAVEDPATANADTYEPTPGTRLVAVELEIGCLADSHHFTPQETSLIDSRGRRHEAVYRAMAAHRAIPTGIISMGDRVRGWLAFELPEGVTAVSLEYKPIAWNRVIELRVSLVE